MQLFNRRKASCQREQVIFQLRLPWAFWWEWVLELVQLAKILKSLVQDLAMIWTQASLASCQDMTEKVLRPTWLELGLSWETTLTTPNKSWKIENSLISNRLSTPFKFKTNNHMKLVLTLKTSRLKTVTKSTWTNCKFQKASTSPNIAGVSQSKSSLIRS